jgi:two-component system sensor histidine kinase/response regulator
LEASRAATVPPAADSSLAGVRVLIVDDHQVNRRVFTETLGRWGMNASAASNGREALALLATAAHGGAPFRLLVSASHMPEMDGFELAAQAKRDVAMAQLSVVLLTSDGRRGDAARCRQAGVAGYLTKPLRSSELKQMLVSVLSNQPAESADPSPLLTRYSLNAGKEAEDLHVLLVEDNPINQRISRALLEKKGYAVTLAENGRKALERFEKQSFDVILMDVQMPEMDGFEATALIRRREKNSGRHVPIIALTAHALKGDEERCLSAGMDSYITKPIDPQRLFQAIESVLVPREYHATIFAENEAFLSPQDEMPLRQ